MTHSSFRLAALVAALSILFGSGTALAHSFNLLIVAPPGDTAVADDMRSAVLIAADERDGHPDNHSDGHLGGLDVYVSLSTDLADPDDWARAQPDIVLDVLISPLSVYVQPDDDWLVLVGSHLDRLDRAAILTNAGNPDLPPFAERFRAVTGRDPGFEARNAYIGARLADLIVRPLDDASDPHALLKELDALP